MKKIVALTGVAAALAFASPAAAQIGVEANGARADGRWGAELGVGYAISILPTVKITPAIGALVYAEDDDRYRRDDNGGNPRCRDLDNGQYADDERCDNTRFKPYGRIEGTVTIPLVATLGLGARIGDEVTPYGTVAFPIAPKLQLKGNAGDGYYALGVRLGF